MSWYCAMGPDCVSPYTDGKGDYLVENSILGHFEAHSLQDPAPLHGLCGYCYFAVFGSFSIHMSPTTVPPRRTA